MLMRNSHQNRLLSLFTGLPLVTGIFACIYKCAKVRSTQDFYQCYSIFEANSAFLCPSKNVSLENTRNDQSVVLKQNKLKL